MADPRGAIRAALRATLRRRHAESTGSPVITVRRRKRMGGPRWEVGSPQQRVTRMPIQRIAKPWGYELLWAHTAQYAGKILAIRRGCQLSLQLHERKEESMYLLSGALEVELEEEDGRTACHRMYRGKGIHIPTRRR